jgi:glyoxylase-like metal-dependent hydrolase (beta-lactamase superfamily II)
VGPARVPEGADTMRSVTSPVGSAPTPKERRPKQEQDPASEEVVEVAPGVLRMQLPIFMPGLGHVNMYGLVDDRGIAVVDPGLPGPRSWRAIQKRLKAGGFRLKDVHTVIVTHSHPDHFGGAGRIAKETGAELITHSAFATFRVNANEARRRESLTEEEAQRLELEAAAAARYLDLGPDDDRLLDPLRADEDDLERTAASVAWAAETPWGGTKHVGPALAKRLMFRALRLLYAPPNPTRRVRHGEMLQLAGREWAAVHTPGHTLDHLCLYDPEHGVLLSGDHVLPSITPHVSGVGNGADSLKSYLDTLDLVAQLDGVSLGLPAHGHPFADVPGRVEAIKEHHQERMEEIQELSATLGPASVVEISHELFPQRHWGAMAESETFAHLEHLVADGKAERWREDDMLVYRVASG